MKFNDSVKILKINKYNKYNNNQFISTIKKTNKVHNQNLFIYLFIYLSMLLFFIYIIK